MRNNQSLYMYPKVPQFQVHLLDKSYRAEFRVFLDPINVSAGASGGAGMSWRRIWSDDTVSSMNRLVERFLVHMTHLHRVQGLRSDFRRL